MGQWLVLVAFELFQMLSISIHGRRPGLNKVRQRGFLGIFPTAGVCRAPIR